MSPSPENVSVYYSKILTSPSWQWPSVSLHVRAISPLVLSAFTVPVSYLHGWTRTQSPHLTSWSRGPLPHPCPKLSENSSGLRSGQTLVLTPGRGCGEASFPSWSCPNAHRKPLWARSRGVSSPEGPGSGTWQWAGQAFAGPWGFL